MSEEHLKRHQVSVAQITYARLIIGYGGQCPLCFRPVDSRAELEAWWERLSDAKFEAAGR